MGEPQDQLSLLPIDAVWAGPAGLGTADCSRICRGHDGCDYVTKEKTKNGHLPHSEWFCTHLAEMVGLASPVCKIIRMPEGTFAFGSRWEGGVATDPWYKTVASGVTSVTDLAPILSRIYSFDQFVHNVDRHGGNFLLRSQRSGHALLAFDYSRAWMSHGFPLPTAPLPATCNTVRFKRQVEKLIGPYIDVAACHELLDKLGKVMKTNIQQILKGQPADWLSSDESEAILGWWGSPLMVDRIDKLKKGFNDGTCL